MINHSTTFLRIKKIQYPFKSIRTVVSSCPWPMKVFTKQRCHVVTSIRTHSLPPPLTLKTPGSNMTCLRISSGRTSKKFGDWLNSSCHRTKTKSKAHLGHGQHPIERRFGAEGKHHGAPAGIKKAMRRAVSQTSDINPLGRPQRPIGKKTVISKDCLFLKNILQKKTAKVANHPKIGLNMVEHITWFY